MARFLGRNRQKAELLQLRDEQRAATDARRAQLEALHAKVRDVKRAKGARSAELAAARAELRAFQRANRKGRGRGLRDRRTEGALGFNKEKTS